MVCNYNRRAALITDFFQKAFRIAARNYYDDKFGFTAANVAQLEIGIVRDVHIWLGADFSEAKIQCGVHPVILGIGYDLLQLRLYVTQERLADLIRTIEELIVVGTMTPAFAAKLKGR